MLRQYSSSPNNAKPNVVCSCYFSCKKSEIVMIVVTPNLVRSNKSLSPVNKKSAFPSTDNESKKLSLGSLQTSILVWTFTKSAYSSMVRSISSMSEAEKKRLNFGRFATSKNSSSNSWLKTKMPCPEKIISSSFVKSLVIKKLRSKAKSAPTLGEITKEVESVRSKRYAK